MLHIHFSNRFERLADQLLARLDGPRADPFLAEQVIVPSTAVRRALTLRMADRHGICAQVEFSYLAQWLWRQIGRAAPEVAAESPFNPRALAWRVHAAFCDPTFVDVHPRLARYLTGADEVMRLDLAQRSASLLEQYVTYRPAWLQAWSRQQDAGLSHADAASGADEQWQAALWRRLTAEIGMEPQHPAQALFAALAQGSAAAAERLGLPAQAHVFALPATAPLHLGLLQGLGRWIELHVYVINPCREYWFELVDRKRLSHLAATGRDQGHEEGQRLLAAWGRQTQAHIDLLLGEAGGEQALDDADFAPHPGSSLLARLQNAILDLQELAPGSVPLADDDRSIEVHACHSLTRELEVLQDHLLGLFGADPGLRPCDVLVVTPDLDAAAPLVEAVFGTAPPARRLPFQITGRARSTVNAPARALLELLALAASRCTATALFGFLQQGLVARRFGLTEPMLAQVHAWMLESGIHWGLDAGHRGGFGVPASATHTLSDGLERLFLGHALPDQGPATSCGALLPAGAAEGSQALALGAFWAFARALQTLRGRLALPHAPAAWAEILLAAVDDFTTEADDEIDDGRELRATVRELTRTMALGGGGVGDGVGEGPDGAALLPLPVVRAALTQWLDDPARGGVPTGSITFSSMSSLRHLPYAVVCMVGLNDGSFPTAARAPEFDLIALHPQRGDRQRRDDERNLFLDLLLAARRSVYLSHTGRSVRDNTPLPPSVLVAELLDVLVPAIATGPDAIAPARRRLVVEHPLQAFSLEAFDLAGDPRRRSHHEEFAQALRQSLGGPAALGGQGLQGSKWSKGPQGLAQAGSAAEDLGAEEPDAEELDEEAGDEAAAADPLAPFFKAPLLPPGPEWREVRVEQLVEFLRNPCRHLLRRRLGIDLQREAEALQDDEPFVQGWPQRKALAERLMPALLAGAGRDEVRALAAAGTELPAGTLGRLQLERSLQALESLSERARAATTDEPLPPHQAEVAFELDGEVWRLSGAYADLRPAGWVRWRTDELRAADRLEAWVHHLLLAACPAPQALGPSRWLALDGTLTLQPVEAPRPLLQSLLLLYRRGLREPLHFFPKSSWVAVDEADKPRRAAETWQATARRPHGESADPAYRLALRGSADPIDAEFTRLAQEVFEPLRAHMAWESPGGVTPSTPSTPSTAATQAAPAGTEA